MNSLRPVHVVPRYLKYPEGSCLFQMGNTKVVCAASVSSETPDHAKEARKGWLTAEYSMLPRAATERTARGKIATGGRTKEISRLIGRSLRAVIDLNVIPDLGLVVDCDVIQADGGTRTAAINGGFIAAVQALRQWRKINPGFQWPIRDFVAAVSVGLLNGKCFLDLDYEKDVRADVDMNVVMTGSGQYVEIQGNAEHKPFSPHDLNRLLLTARQGIRKLLAIQKQHLGDLSK